MGEFYDQLDENVASHLSGLTGSIQVDDDQEALELLAKGWLEKEEAFSKQLEDKKMEMVEEFDPASNDGALLLLTYSGSLLNIGPVIDGKRSSTYASIGLRGDVPEFAEEADSEVDGEIKADEIVRFSRGPIKSSSRIYKMAVFTEDLASEEEEELLAEVTQVLAEDFAEVNRTIISGD